MQHLDSVEEILGRLMPPALSQSCEEEIGAALDDLAACGPPAASLAAPRPMFRWWAGGIAAAGAMAAFLLPMLPDGEAPIAAAPLPAKSVVLVSESGRVESMRDEGFQDLGDGSAMFATRLNVVEESNLLDEETGIVVQISEPREEVLLMPVSAF